MVRPQSIVRYERVYLASIALWLIAYLVNWPTMVALLARNPALEGQIWLLWARMLLGLAISLTLWFFTARSPRIVAKWIVAIFGAFAALGLLFSLVQLGRGRVSFDLPFILTITVDILSIVAAMLLFRPDAALWFGELPAADAPFA